MPIRNDSTELRGTTPSKRGGNHVLPSMSRIIIEPHVDTQPSVPDPIDEAGRREAVVMSGAVSIKQFFEAATQSEIDAAIAREGVNHGK